ncbi:MAG: hypothetical protein HFJ46_05380 [Clostridia bacterium]|nr:hypothetical protein [Clostridia bacterium]
MSDAERKTEVSNVENNINEEKKESSKKIIGTLGNFILTALIALIIGTGALAYYLVNSARKDLENNTNLILNVSQNEADQEADSIANIIDTVVSDVTTPQNTSSNANKDASTIKLLNEDLIVLYNGLVLKTDKMEEKELQYIDNSNDFKENYVITYYNYENFSFKDSKLGTLSSQIFDGVVKVENVGKIAISENYNAIPREVKVVNSVPTIVSDNNDKIKNYDITKTIIADLDGNGTDEYILILANKSTGYSKIMLADSKGIKVDDLAYIEKSKWESVTNEEYYLSISNIEVIDIDNDGIMEILIELPKSDGASTKISLLKYKTGELQGKANIECSLLK